MSAGYQRKCEEEELQLGLNMGTNMADTERLAPKRCPTGLIICILFILITAAGMFCFCFVYHLRLDQAKDQAKDLCYAQGKAALIDNRIKWDWTKTECIKRVNDTTVVITRDGIYMTDIQVFSEESKALMDINLKISRGQDIWKDFVGGAYDSAIGETTYARMSPFLLLNKGDKVTLEVNGKQNSVSVMPRDTYWMIVKITG